MFCGHFWLLFSRPRSQWGLKYSGNIFRTTHTTGGYLVATGDKPCFTQVFNTEKSQEQRTLLQATTFFYSNSREKINVREIIGQGAWILKLAFDINHIELPRLLARRFSSIQCIVIYLFFNHFQQTTTDQCNSIISSKSFALIYALQKSFFFICACWKVEKHLWLCL